MANSYSSDTRGQIEQSAPNFNASSLIGAGVVVAGLYFGREVLLPFVIAVLLSFVLAIPVKMLQGWGLGRKFPVGVVVLLAFGVIISIGAIVTTQLADLAGDLPRYQSTIREKISTLKGAAAGHGPLERAAEMVQDLADEVSGPPRTGDVASSPGEATPQRPLPVEVTNARTSPLSTITSFVTPLIHPIATMGLIAVFVVFILLQRGDLRNRAIRLAGSHDLQRTTAAMNDAARRLSKYFLFQVLLNSSFGLVVGLGLWAMGIPSPILWGILAAISRFVPYVGVVIAAGGPLVLAAAVDPNWTLLVFTAGFFLCSEFLLGQVVEPLLYGHSTGLSPIAVIASVTFWTWLWGPLGLILATPLTVCLVVLGRHVDRMAFLDVMLGDRPPLTVAEGFYQRLLAGDAAEATEQAELFLKDHSLATFYDEVAVKGLALAQIDLTRGALDPAALARIEATTAELVEELAEHEVEVPSQDTKKTDVKRADGDEDLDETLDTSDSLSEALPILTPDMLAEAWRGDAAVLVVAGRNELDRTSALMLAQIIRKHGLGVQVENSESLTPSGIVRLSNPASRIVCLSYLDTTSPVYVRYAVRRLRRRLPDAQIIVGSWGLEADASKGLCEVVRSDSCASRLTDAARICLEAAAADPGASESRASESGTSTDADTPSDERASAAPRASAA